MGHFKILNVVNFLDFNCMYFINVSLIVNKLLIEWMFRLSTNKKRISQQCYIFKFN
jgi:hypothetical protein